MGMVLVVVRNRRLVVRLEPLLEAGRASLTAAALVLVVVVTTTTAKVTGRILKVIALCAGEREKGRINIKKFRQKTHKLCINEESYCHNQSVPNVKLCMI